MPKHNINSPPCPPQASTDYHLLQNLESQALAKVRYTIL